MITIESQGDWKLTRNWFDRMTKLDLALIMNQFDHDYDREPGRLETHQELV
nr:MAG TPA: hypothetical protein [Caudoviricetes sp.]DAU92685.1 MAG TPA: hypothetical protein [Caudoviricetes sp.]